MKKSKFDLFNLYCGIHTVSIRTDQQPRLDSNGNLPVGVEDRGMSKTGMLTLKINPNKYVGDGVELYSFADYCAAMRQILAQMQIDHYYYNRMHPYANCQTGYMEIKFGDTNRERPSLHRLVGYHFRWQKDCPDLPFESLDIHHIASIHENQAWNLSAMPKVEHIKLHQRLNKAGIVGLKEPLAI